MLTAARRPNFCKKHARDGTINLGKKCAHEGCSKVPSYAVPGTRTRTFCAEHAPDGMVPLFDKKRDRPAPTHQSSRANYPRRLAGMSTRLRTHNSVFEHAESSSMAAGRCTRAGGKRARPTAEDREVPRVSDAVKGEAVEHMPTDDGERSSLELHNGGDGEARGFASV